MTIDLDLKIALLESPFLVVGSNTDVGKTFFSGLILKSAHEAELKCAYLKPVQTGYPVFDDAKFVAHLSGVHRCASLFQFQEPISPHRCAEASQVSDRSVLEKSQGWLQAQALDFGYSAWGSGHSSSCDSQLFFIVEGAGGVLSPMPSGSLALEAFRPLRLPLILVCDAKLGGISQSLASIDACRSRGYDIALVVFFRGRDGNAEFVEEQIQKYGIPVCEIPFDLKTEWAPETEERESVLISESMQTALSDCLKKLTHFRKQRASEIAFQSKVANRHFWWPFTQHKNSEAALVVDSAFGSNITVAQGNNLKENSLRLVSRLDASASWWTLGAGHAHPYLTSEISAALGRYGHVLFPGQSHMPAALLAEKIVNGVGKDWASRVFFSDNGSTAVEVALKMAFRLAKKRGILGASGLENKPTVLGLSDSYHGDTLGAMCAASANLFNASEDWYQPIGKWLDFPRLVLKDGCWQRKPSEAEFKWPYTRFDSLHAIFDLKKRLVLEIETVSIFKEKILSAFDSVSDSCGCVLIEPVIHGASGMHFVDPLFQHLLVEVAKARKIPVVFDEVFSGYWRFGVESAAELLALSPDVSCFSKTLTGGALPMAVTVAREEVFEAFLGDKKSEALLHGHSYTAHPAGCAAAVASLKLYEQLGKAPCEQTDERFSRLEYYWSNRLVREISCLKIVDSVVALGTVFAVTLNDHNAGYESSRVRNLVDSARKNNLELRPLGNVAYLMVNPLVSAEECEKYLENLLRCLNYDQGVD